MANSTWLTSLDVTSFVKNMMQRQTLSIDKATQKQLNQLTATQTGFSTQVSVLGQLQSLISTLRTNVSQAVAAFDPDYKIASSDPDSLAAELIDAEDSDLVAATHQVVVTTLAQAETYSSNNFSSTATPGAETLDITVAGVNFSVNIAASDTLQMISDKINTAANTNSAAVTASVVSTGSNQYQLVITSNNTGTANAVSVTGDTTLGLAERLAATNAVFTFDGISFSKSSNSDIQTHGLSINLLNTGTNYITVSATNTADNVKNALQKVVDAYNQVVTLIQKTQASPLVLTDADGNKVTVSQDNGALTPILAQLQSTMSELFDDNDGYESLSSIGIVPADAQSLPVQTANGDTSTIYITGLLKLDAAAGLYTPPVTLSSALADNFSAVQTLLTDEDNGILTKLDELVDPLLGSIPRTLLDTQSRASQRATEVTRQIEDIKDKADVLKQSLLLKYAQLEMSMSSMQSTGIFLAQQLQAARPK